jgi:hypothetical protein
VRNAEDGACARVNIIGRGRTRARRVELTMEQRALSLTRRRPRRSRAGEGATRLRNSTVNSIGGAPFRARRSGFVRAGEKDRLFARTFTRSRRSERNPIASLLAPTAHSPAPSSRTPGFQSPSFRHKERRARDGRRHARRVPSDRPGPDRNRAWRSCLERVRSRARSRARGRERRPRLCRLDARDGSQRCARRARRRRVALRVVDQGRASHARVAKYPQSDRPERCVLLRDRTCRATQRAAPVPYPPETTRASRPRSARLTDARERRTRTHDFVEPSFSAPVVGHERDDTSSCFFLRKTNFPPRASVLYLFRADLDRRPTRPRPVR